MEFLDLPNELIMDVAGYLGKARDFSSLSRVNRRIFAVLNPILYRDNIKKQRSSALFWAADCNRVSTARRIIHFGVDVNVRRANMKNVSGSNLTALHIAAWRGHLAVVKILLDAGADPEAQVLQGFTPLYLALTGRHEKVARTISWRIGNLQTCLVHHWRLWTPVHVSAFLGLPDCVRFFLNAGAEVDARDSKSMTPLYHTLMRDNRTYSHEDAFGNPQLGETRHPYADDLFKITEILLEFHANPDIEVPSSAPGEPPVSARYWGELHWSRAIRSLFDENEIFEYYDDSTSDVQIGRPWMPALLQEGSQAKSYESASADGVSAEDLSTNSSPTFANAAPAFQINSRSFPPFSSGQAPISDRIKPITRGPWSRSRPFSEQFPPLTSQSSKASSESRTGPARAYSEEAKGAGATGKPLFISENDTSESSQSETRRKKAGRKPQWQPIKI